MGLKGWQLVSPADHSHHVVLAFHHAVGRQHGSLHSGALEHPFDLAANAADPEGLAPLRRAPAEGPPGLAKCYWRKHAKRCRCAWFEQRIKTKKRGMQLERSDKREGVPNRDREEEGEGEGTAAANQGRTADGWEEAKRPNCH